MSDELTVLKRQNEILRQNVTALIDERDQARDSAKQIFEQFEAAEKRNVEATEEIVRLSERLLIYEMEK